MPTVSTTRSAASSSRSLGWSAAAAAAAGRWSISRAAPSASLLGGVPTARSTTVRFPAAYPSVLSMPAPSCIVLRCLLKRVRPARSKTMAALLEVARTGFTSVRLHPVRSGVTLAALVAVLLPYLACLGLSQGLQDEAETSVRMGADL